MARIQSTLHKLKPVRAPSTRRLPSKRLLESAAQEGDVTLVGSGFQKKAHAFILKLASPYFQAKFDRWSTVQMAGVDTPLMVELPAWATERSVELLLGYAYCDVMSDTEMEISSPEDVVGVLRLACGFQLSEAKHDNEACSMDQIAEDIVILLKYERHSHGDSMGELSGHEMEWMEWHIELVQGVLGCEEMASPTGDEQPALSKIRRAALGAIRARLASEAHAVDDPAMLFDMYNMLAKRRRKG